tara:strand:+ start:9247 stop:11214 length:1968 start_codon:yes stop_codon:yes gene_type:complete
MEHALAFQLVTVLALGTVLIALFQSIGLSPVIGYITCGVLVGPSVLNWLPDGPTTRLLAELGIVLLMFTIGLEFSLPRLLASKRLVLGLGGSQVLVTTLLLGLPAYALGLDLGEALLFGVALAMSSTAIALKQLGEQAELPARHGRAVTAILLFQDIAAIFVLAMLPILTSDPERLLPALGLSVAKAAVVFVSLVFIGRRLLPFLLHWVAGTRSLELFMLTALLMAVAAAGLSQVAGLSSTLGAFMAGMLLGETVFRHQLETDIRPFRDLMLGLFFATIGMQLDPAAVARSPEVVAMVVVALTICKPLVLMPLAHLFGQGAADGWRASISLAQGGEFGLMLVSSALALGVADAAVAQPVLAGLILSMLVAPLLLNFNRELAGLLTAGSSDSPALETEAQVAAMSSEFEHHVIICGFGHLGKNLLRILSEVGISALALDFNSVRVRQAAARGAPVMFGNAVQPGMLRAAGVDRARAVAITFGDVQIAERIITHIRGGGVDLPILARSTRVVDDVALVTAGATAFPENLETSLAFAGQLMVMLDLPSSRIEAGLNSIRASDYAPLRLDYDDAGRERSADSTTRVCSVVIAEGAAGEGRRLQELCLGDMGVEVVEVRRHAIRVPGHLLDTCLRAGDVVMFRGTPETLEQAVAVLAGRQ